MTSALLLLHLTALFVGPCASPPPSSELARQCERLLDPYLQIAFLKNHGYRFFAPNPGPSHLVRYEMEMPDGTKQSGVFPDRDNHWPRLLYHRHFMLSEMMFNLTNIPDELPADADIPEAQRLAFARAVAQRDEFVRSIAQHLLRSNGGQRVTLTLREHGIAAPEDVLGGIKLDDPRSFRELTLGTFTGDGP